MVLNVHRNLAAYWGRGEGGGKKGEGDIEVGEEGEPLPSSHGSYGPCSVTP